MVLIFLLRYIPMFGIVVAFEDFRADTGFFSPWVGFKNFQLLFGSPVLWRIVRNTLVLNVLFITVGTIAAVGMALMINELGKPLFKKLTQSIMYLPFFMSWTVVAMILYGFLDYDSGMVNNVLSRIGNRRAVVLRETGVVAGYFNHFACVERHGERVHPLSGRFGRH